MTKQKLKKYCAKRIEIDKLEDEIAFVSRDDYVSDVVVGSYGQPVVIKGYGSSDIHAQSRRKAKLEDECRQIEQFIESIDDSLMRMAVSLKYINGLSWQQVAASIGGRNTADGVRKACDRFFRKI